MLSIEINRPSHINLLQQEVLHFYIVSLERKQSSKQRTFNNEIFYEILNDYKFQFINYHDSELLS